MANALANRLPVHWQLPWQWERHEVGRSAFSICSHPKVNAHATLAQQASVSSRQPVLASVENTCLIDASTNPATIVPSQQMLCSTLMKVFRWRAGVPAGSAETVQFLYYLPSVMQARMLPHSGLKETVQALKP